MPIPKLEDKEDRNKFMSRCMSDPKMREEYKQGNQRVAVCLENATDGMNLIQKADFEKQVKEYGYAEEIDEDNFYVPAEADYVDFGEEEVEWDSSTPFKGLVGKKARYFKDKEALAKIFSNTFDNFRIDNFKSEFLAQIYDLWIVTGSKSNDVGLSDSAAWTSHTAKSLK